MTSMVVPAFAPVSLNEAAALVDRSPDELLQAASEGRLAVFTTVKELLTWKNGAAGGSGPDTPPPMPPPVAAGAGMVQLTLGPWKEIPPFTHRWPDGSDEPYPEAYECLAQVNGRPRVIVIGYTKRTSAGMTDRERVSVFYQSPPKQRALVEFSGDAVFPLSTQVASPIKPQGGNSQLRPGDPVPSEYQGMAVDLFSNVVQGPYAANSVAVVAARNDRDTIARHGVIRGVYKGWL